MAKMKEITITKKLTIKGNRGHFFGTELSAIYELENNEDENEVIENCSRELLDSLDKAVGEGMQRFNIIPNNVVGR